MIEESIPFEALEERIAPISEDADLCTRIALCLVEKGCIRIKLSPESISVMDKLGETARDFFSLPVDEKMQACSPDRARRGYSPLFSENFASLIGEKGRPNDSVEKLRFGPPPPAAAAVEEFPEYYGSKVAKFVHFLPNETEQLSQMFNVAISRYYSLMEHVSNCVLRALESTFRLSRGSLTSHVTAHHTSILSINHYPVLDEDTGEKRERVAEHTDVSLFTIVAAIQAHSVYKTCLQIRPRVIQSTSGHDAAELDTWEDIPLKSGEVLVNVGDYLKYVSGGRLHSARHRVISINSSVDMKPEIEQSRVSFAFFCAPRYDVQMKWEEQSIDETTCTDVEFCDKDNNGGFDEALTYDQWRKMRIARALRSMKNK